ncbi:MAG TPA: NUDIX hydrolase [Candidatus Dorea intestinavium]|nr:NUDIX hydrolase [Candidatus Dorea intestinavium]
MDKNIKRVKRELAYEGTILNVYKDYMEFSNGNHAVWDFIHHVGASCVLPVLADGRLLMVKQYRNALERMTIEVPAGKLDAPDEDPLLCAKRELEEETGYVANHLEYLMTLRTTVAFCDEKIEVYLAKDLEKKVQHLDEDEFIELESFTLAQLKEMIFAGKIQDSKTVAAILAYATKIKE